MKLTTLHTIDNDWIEQISRPDQVAFACSDVLNLIGALRASVVQLQETLRTRTYRAKILFPNGSYFNCIVETNSLQAATAEAEKISDEYELSIVESIYEIPKQEAPK
jgi:hypothetical protein